MNSKQIILISIIFIILIGTGWYYFDKLKPKTSNSTNTREEIIYKKNSKTIQYIKKYHPNGKIMKLTSYRDDGENIDYINEYNENGQQTKDTHYHPDNKKNIWYIGEYNPVNGQKTKSIHYEKDGETILFISEYNPDGTIKPKEVEKPKPKTSISQTRFDEIKNYILSLDDNLLPKNLNPTEKTKIEEIRTTMKSLIQSDQKHQKKIEDEQKTIDDYNNKLNEIENKKNELEPQQSKLKKNREDKTKEIDQIKLQLKNQGKPFYNNPKVIKLQDERMEIIKQIVDVERQIADLDADKKMYTNMLKRAESMLTSLQSRFETLPSNEKIVIDELNKIYEIN